MASTQADHVAFAYDNASGNATVSNALGEPEVYLFATVLGTPKVAEIDRQATSTTAAATRMFTYDSNGYLASQTDWDGNKTTFVNDFHGQPTATVEAAGTPQARTTTATYLSNFHLPSLIARPDITTNFAYDGSGNLLTKTVTDTTATTVPYSTNAQTRVSTFTYGSYGLPATAKTARSDVNGTTTYTYSQGAVTKITNALGQNVAITNTAGGRPSQIVDANGVTTTLGYDSRQRLTSKAVSTTAGPLTTTFGYDAAGNLLSTTFPDGSGLTNTYDTAHRLTKVTDSLGNYTSFTLDGLGDRTQTSIYSKAGTLTWQGSGTFDALGRELVHTAGAGQTTTKTYDSNGNTLTVADGLSHITTNTYDALNRLNKSTDANSGVTTPAYDTNDRIVSLTDAIGNATAYARDGFGDVIQQSSPDSGTTVFHYDSDANLTSKTDALGIVTNQTFDALDRPLTTTYPAHAAENVVYTYDQTGMGYSFGVGRLTSATDASGAETRTYDERGNLLTDKHVNGSTTLTTGYTYDGASRVASMTYPDGTLVSYQHDVAGYVSGVTAKLPGATSATTLGSISHQPFGPIGGVTFGNSVAETWKFDQAYRPTSLVDSLSGMNVQSLTYIYDKANNVSSIVDAVTAANSQTFGYDALNRLTSTASGTGGYGTQAWTYDKVGNRLTQVQGATTTTYGYTPGSNRLLTITAGATKAALQMPPSVKRHADAGLMIATNGPPTTTKANPATGPPAPQAPTEVAVAALLGWPALFLGLGVLWTYRKRLREHLLLVVFAGILFTGGAAAILGCGSTGPTALVVAAPTFSLAMGTYTSAQSVTLSDSSSGASIYYTTDGSTPTANSTKYSGPIPVATTETIQAIAVGATGISSATASAAYTISSLAAATPTFSLAGGTFTTPQSVTITDTTSGATIYYTTDGTTPTVNSSKYASPISIVATETLQSIAVASGYANSTIASATYTISAPVAATPTFSPTGTTSTLPQSVTITDTTAGATIYYTTDGTTPTAGSIKYSGTPISISTTEVLQAIALASGYANSAVASATYTILSYAATPVFSPSGGTFTTAQSVTITDATAGATIYYTTDGTIPTVASTKYTSPILVTGTVSLQAVAVANGFAISNVATAIFSFGAATPVLSLPAGTYASSQTVTISDSTVGAAIYYTTNGSTPTTSSTRYTSAITVSSTETISAFAVASAYSNSATATAAYTIAVLAAAPTFSPVAGSFSSVQTVTIADATAGAVIYYTIDGSTPTATSPVYSAPLTISGTETVNAFALASGYTNSPISSATYAISLPVAATPAFPSGPVINPTPPQVVTITDSTPGAVIYYTTDGSTPTAGSARYTSPLTVTTAETIKAIAVASGYANSAVGSTSISFIPTTATPTFSPAAGTFSTAQTVTISDSTAGSTIYYTTNGSTPTTSSASYTGPVSVSGTETITAIAVATGDSNSAAASATYTITTSVAALPTFSPAAGSFTSSQSVTISDTTASAAIYYTTDGSTPTVSSTQYTGPVTVSASETLSAIALASGYTNSSVATAAYVITQTAAAPTFSPSSGSFSAVQAVTLTDVTTGAVIYYTLNGSVPSTGSTKYSGPITVSSTETINAIAVASGYTNSVVSSGTYTITLPAAAAPSFSPGSGIYTLAQTVAISDGTPGAAIYYTTDGTTPTSASIRYSGPVAVSSTETLNAIAVASGYTNSAVATAAYVISLTAATPTYSPTGGSFGSVQTVALADTTTGAVIYFTTDGTLPSTSSTRYTGPIAVGSTQTINAIAVASGFTNSAVATATYTISLPATATPSFSPSSGTYTSAPTVTISDATSGAAIYYTTDGTTPTAASIRYSGPVAVSSTETLSAVALASGYTNSTIGTAAYTISANSCLNTVTTNANGNITGVPSADGVYCLTFTFNNANRSASVTGGTLAATFVYDWAGQRYSKTNGGSPPTVYSYSQDGAVIAENDGGTVTDYVYIDGRPVAVIQPTATPATNQIGYVTADRLGAPQRVTNGSGGTIWSTGYQPFGITGTISASIQQDLRFPGQITDIETGFSYNLNRDYMPDLGRYLESDPTGLRGGANLYGYALQNPNKWTDRSGLCPNTTVDAPNNPACSAPKYAQARSFISANLGYAQQIASRLNTSPGNILGLSGNESGWGTGFLITAGTNNYFSLTAGKAFGGTIGTYQHGSYTYGVYPSPGFLSSGQSFANSYFGARVNGISDPLAFSQALNANGSFNSENLATPYDRAIANTINLANTLIGCHD